MEKVQKELNEIIKRLTQESSKHPEIPEYELALGGLKAAKYALDTAALKQK